MSYENPPPPPPPGPYGGHGGPYEQPGSAGTSQLAIWALVTGILGFCCGPIGIAAIILGQRGKQQIDRSGGRQSGRGMAQAGFILGIIGVALWIIAAIARLSGAFPSTAP